MKRLFAATVLFGMLLVPTVGARDANRAGLVVRTSESDVRKMCVAFDDEQITGADLLERSGLELEAERGSIGTAMCSIGGKGCSSDDCFCRYPTFWGYWTGKSDQWHFSDVGAAQRIVRDGTVDGWSWGRDGRPPPPEVSFDDICSAAPARAKRATSQRSAPDYVPFAIFGAVLVAGGVLVARRRRVRP